MDNKGDIVMKNPNNNNPNSESGPWNVDYKLMFNQTKIPCWTMNI